MRDEIKELVTLVEAQRSATIVGSGYALTAAITSQAKLVETLNNKEIADIIVGDSGGCKC